MKRLLLVLIGVGMLSFSGKNKNTWKAQTENADYIHRSIKAITDIMVHDIYSPPVASRTYAYICIAGYEAALPGYSNYRSLAGQLHGLKNMPKPKTGREYSPTLAAVQAILGVGKTMVVSEAKVDEFYVAIIKEFKRSGIP